MRILIKNGNLISMSENYKDIDYGVDVLIENEKIIKIGSINEDCDKAIDATGKIVMPGLINTHAHIGMSVFRETIDGLTLQDWLNNKIWPMEDKLVDDDIYWATLLSGFEMISCGCTTINDMYFMTDSSIKAMLDAGCRLQTTRTLMGNDSSDYSRINELKELINNYRDNDLITFNCGIHGFYTSNLDYIRECCKFAKSNDLAIHIHFLENSKERKTILENYDVATPAELVRDEFMGMRNILAHSVKVSDKDIEILKNTNSYVSHCPVSNMKLACGVSPVAKMLDEGICVSLGTDGQGSGSNLDMFEEMKLCALLQKGSLEDPVMMDAYEVLKMATVNGAKTLGLFDKIGSIDVGKLADIIIVDMDSVLVRPTNNVFAQLVYNTKGSDVLTTIVNGCILMEDRVVSHIDKELIIDKCSKIIDRINV